MYTRMHTYAGKRGETNRPIREWHVPTTTPYPSPFQFYNAGIPGGRYVF